MPRRPLPRYFESRGGYYVQLNGKQRRLATGPDDGPTGPTYLLALDEFKKLLESTSLDTAGDGSTVRSVLDRYL